MSVNSEYLNTSVSSDDQQQHVKPSKIKINSPSVTPKMEKMLGVGKSVTIINSPQQLSRASSSMSLASATNSMAAEEVRSFSNNYEHLLQQATVSIRRLTKDKAGLEAEQDRLLNVNIDLATEVKRLLALDKENKAERKVSSKCRLIGQNSSSQPLIGQFSQDQKSRGVRLLSPVVLTMRERVPSVLIPNNYTLDTRDPGVTT